MLKYFFLFILVTPLSIFAQSTKLLQNIDTTYVPNNKIIEANTSDSFFNSGLGDEKIDYNNLNQNLFNASIFFAFNKKRKEKKKKELAYSSTLDYLAYNCIQFYSKSKFKPSTRNKALYEKNLYLAGRNLKINYHLFSANIAIESIMSLEKKRNYHKDKLDSTTTYKLYYRNPKELKGEAEDIVEALTYNEFASLIVKKWFSKKNKKNSNSKSYMITACYVKIVDKSMYKNRAPYAKVIQILGASRLEVPSN